jgi:ubiquinone/menaquinone biosynthesis C-methylase UbiE
MAIIESILGRPYFRQKLWQWWYPYFTRKVKKQGIDFLNYAFETDPPMQLSLDLADELNRPNIQLYHHVASQTKLKNKKVLEVSCGHGGGASFVKRYLEPAEYTAIDLNPLAIKYCQEKHIIPGLEFRVGDAMSLPFSDESFDCVINVEASHCYPSFPKFLNEVARVLKPGGQFVYADLRYSSQLEEWKSDLFSHTSLQVNHMRLINPEIIRGMELNTPRYTQMVKQCLPKFWHKLAFDFAGIKDSRLYRDAQSGELSYRSFLLTKNKN